ncbi:MAG: response regulator transcription factor [Desulfovibrionaceae bacterium]|nr:response regulator transcription factor [Desulfovibrionaceae bacterium]
MRVWCVEDDVSIREMELYALKAANFETEGFEDGHALLEALKQERPDLVLLDVMLPGLDGLEILRRMRANPDFHNLPVILATARGTEYDKILGLDAGADYYLEKPFGMMEMLACVRSVLRRTGQKEEPSGILRCRDLVLNSEEHTVTADGVPVVLTYKEFEMLRLFLSHPGMVFTRESLFNRIWGLDYVGETRTVDMHIRTLRRKLGSYASLIETVRNVGYKLGKQHDV